MSFYLYLISFFCFFSFSLQSFEIRAILKNVDASKEYLQNNSAQYLGEYAFIDYIYSQSIEPNLNQEFIRIRHYYKTQWDQKPVLLVHKKRDRRNGHHQLLFKVEADTLDEAQKQLPMRSNFLFSFFRRGWEYQFQDMHIFVER